MQTIKILSLWIVIGALFGGMLAAVVSKYDDYTDWLLVKQTIGLGAVGGLVSGFVFLRLRSEELTKQSIVYQPLTQTQTNSLNETNVVKPQVEKQIKEARTKSFWSFLWRGGLIGLLGMLAGIAAGVAFCISQYDGLSYDAKAWVLFYIPLYIFYVFVAGILGFLAGTCVGIAWNLFRT